MTSADLLIAPLRILVTALGTGVLPGNDPVSAIAALAPDLASTRDDALAAATRLGSQWQGRGAEAAEAASRVTAGHTTAITGDDAQIVTLTQSAAQRVHGAARQLESLVDSFDQAARGLGADLFSPTGLAVLLPLAIDHVGRGVAVVERTRAELAADTAALAELARHDAPAPVTRTGGPGERPAITEGGVAITLPDGSIAHAPNERAAAAVRAALSQQGVPYVWGGTDPSGFDCSGLTQWAYRQAGLELPRLAQEQDSAGFAVAQADLMPGDLAVWDGHVAMYVGNNQLVEAGDPVQVSPLRTTNAGQGFQGFYRPR
ncbi:NlpC/P60 family protein [Gordonia sp. L191]|uniref:C40 family peptidase n=1 Tax=Gordonia sp. L191 TaxID=2982699 RepID=UPI0024C0B8E5|nr:C40 family peptidase [Gordonia sp. L191]WHU45372.1 NlpC/P60 family protein [Gordonia sp. L191]